MAMHEQIDWIRMLDNTARPRHSLITVAYNSAADIVDHWGELDLNPAVEWIVVDNNSRDDSAVAAERIGAQVIRLRENIGFGGANNVGFQRSSGEFVWFTNPDVSVRIEDLDRLAEVAQREMALVAPQLCNPDGSLQPNGRGLPSLFNKVLNRIASEKVKARYHVYADENEVKSCSWLMGAVVGGQRQLLSTLGPWDERFFVYYEDSDLGLRATRAGYRNLIVGSCRWEHSWARDTARFRVRPWLLEISSMRKFYLRYPRLLLISRNEVG
jgi:GT2 family glycosyltransferase